MPLLKKVIFWESGDGYLVELPGRVLKDVRVGLSKEVVGSDRCSDEMSGA